MSQESIQAENVAHLQQALEEAGVSVQAWGGVQTKNLEELFQELQHGDCILQNSEQYGVIRKMNLVVVMLEHQEYLLLEKQQQNSQTGETRSRKLAGTLIEKLMADESPESGAARVLAEEMDITGDLNLSSFQEGDHFLESASYPGLWTHYHIFYTVCPMPGGLYKKSYQVEYDDWTTTWEWVPKAQQASFFLSL